MTELYEAIASRVTDLNTLTQYAMHRLEACEKTLRELGVPHLDGELKVADVTFTWESFKGKRLILATRDGEKKSWREWDRGVKLLLDRSLEPFVDMVLITLTETVDALKQEESNK